MRHFSVGSCVRLAGTVFCIAVLLCAQVQLSKLNLFEIFLKGPTESILIQFRDGDIFIYTTQDERMVDLHPVSIAVDLTRVRKKQIADIIQITHNHLTRQSFGEGDNKFLRYFEEQGFVGDFCIYHTQSKKVETKKTGARGEKKE